MANILTGSFGNANEQVFYGDAGNIGKMESAQMIFPNGEMGTVGGGEFVTVTKYMTGIFGEKYPYVTTEFVPNKPVVMKRATEKVLDNIGYAGVVSDVQSGFGVASAFGGAVAQPMQGGWGMIGGFAPAVPVEAPKAKECPSGWIDNGLTCMEPIKYGCRNGDRDDGIFCFEGNGNMYPKQTSGGQIMSKY